jgi:hypothetical protein
MKKKKLKEPYEATAKDYKCARMIRNAAFTFLKKDLAFSLHDDSFEMTQLALKDFLELLLVSKRLERGGSKAASKLVYDLDTSVREEIPQTAYDHIMGD